MMLQIIGYTIAVSAALSVIAVSVERIAVLQKLPRRPVWIAAMLLSVLLPLVMILLPRPAQIEPVAVPVARFLVPAGGLAGLSLPPAPPGDQVAIAEVGVPARSVPVAAAPRAAWTMPRPSDAQLVMAWMICSSAIALYLLVASLLLHRRAAGWQRSTMLGHDIVVSEATGPALLGVLRPRIVVPRWLLLQPEQTQSLVLEHESQHLRMKDPLLIFAGLFVGAAVPWNLPLWWQWRRMRHAIELDCDARVMRSGAEAATYAEVLLAVARRATRIPAGALAMSEPVHALEMRIDNLSPEAFRHAKAQFAAALLLAFAAGGAALALEAPALPLGMPANASLPLPGTVVTPLAMPSAVLPAAAAAATQPAVIAAAPAPRTSDPARAVQAQPSDTQSPVQLSAATPTFKVRLQRREPKPEHAAAIPKLDSYYKALSTRLRAIPGLSLVTPAPSGVAGLDEAASKLAVDDIDYEVSVYVAVDGSAIDIEADSRRPRAMRVIWASDPSMLPGIGAGSSPLFPLASSQTRMPEDPERDMDSLVERMRKDLFPRDPVRMDQWMDELSDPRREASVRLAALGKLLDYAPPLGSGSSGPLQPSAELLNAVTEFAMTADDPAVRLRVWQNFSGLRLSNLADPSVLAAPAIRALTGEKDLKVQLLLLTLMSVKPATPGVRATLESVAGSERPELVRKAAQRLLDGNEGWNVYFATMLNDPKIPDADKGALISYMASVSGGINKRIVGAAAATLDEAGVRSLAVVLNKSAVRELRTSALQLMWDAGDTKLVNGLFIDFLRSSADRAMEDREVRSWVLSELTFRSRYGLALAEDVRTAVEEISARDPDPELRQKAREALQVTGLR